MPARVLPPTSELRRLVDMGLTHQQIADRIARERGIQVSRSTVSAALHRGGAATPAKRYTREVPWTVKEEHQNHYGVRMLRLLGRRNKGIANSAENDMRLDAWLARLAEDGTVVVYVPDTIDGFFYVEGTPDHPGIPVMADLKVS